MILVFGSFTIGLILSLLAFGVLITFRIFHFPDITAEGSFTLGASVAAILIVKGVHPVPASFIAFCCGMLAGTATGIIHARFKIHGLLAGILMMTALYSVNLHVMGKSNVPLLYETTLITYTARIGRIIMPGIDNITILGWNLSVQDAAVFIMAFLMILIVGTILYLFFHTNLGTAMRAAGDNSQMIRALGVNVGNMIILGLAVSNGLIALSGAFLAQYQGFADIQMGIGMLVWGLASVIIGEAMVSSSQLGLKITGVVIGSVLFRLLIAVALRWGLNPNDLKLITALFVFAALVLPGFLRKIQKKEGVVSHAQSERGQ
jgi:putative ABC transport system permease protein